MKLVKEFLIYIKELFVAYVKSRIFPVTLLSVVLSIILVNRLFYLQIRQGATYTDDLVVRTEKTLTIPSIRGRILDNTGKVLAYNKLTYNLTFGNDTRLSARAEELGVEENVLKNQVVSDTIDILTAEGDSLSLYFPIKLEKGIYSFTNSETSRPGFLRDVYAASSYDELSDEEKNSTAEEVVQVLRKRFDLQDTYTPERELMIMGCRYQLWLNRFQQYVPVEIAQDISEKSRSTILENQDRLFGMDIKIDSIRIYNDAKYFAHIIGYVGTASEDDLLRLNQDENSGITYTTSDVVGKTGVELIYENELHGRDGSETMQVDNLGRIMEVTSTTPAQSGGDVYLTIDANLTKYCYDMLEKEIASILIAHMIDYNYPPDDNKDNVIAITDVYAGLFNNNQIRLSRMKEAGATAHEQQIYRIFRDKKEAVLSGLRSQLGESPAPVGGLSVEYQNYCEYICEFLAAKGTYLRSRVEDTDPTFVSYINGTISLQSYLRYLISIEAIDVTEIEEKDVYYDSDEIYHLLAEYILKYLAEDDSFDKMVIKVMLQQGSISGNDVIHLLYEQGVLNEENDRDYADYRSGLINAFTYFRNKLTSLDITPAMLALKPCSGSIVVTDVRTGEVRALVSYPSYDNNYLTNSVDPEYYSTLLADKTTPLNNRACTMRTAPGSTYKVISSIAGVEEGVLRPTETIKDEGIFEEVYTKPACWLYNKNGSNHGDVDIIKALDVSCNYFYYVVGFRLSTRTGTYIDSEGINALAKYASQFGLDAKSGVELDEISPHISDNDAVTSAIGQGKNSFAPIQLSRYVSTVANNGTCYDLTLLSRITDSSGRTIRAGEHQVHSKVQISDDLWNRVHEGMRLVVTDDLDKDKMLNGIRVAVAGKTGTAQENTNDPSHALFLSYAPYEAPEVSVTTVIQNGYASANAAEVTAFIYAYMYDKEKLTDSSLNGTGTLSD
ncbi:MAG: hypothetical protein IKQ49_00865 [Eubacterium sp.]|nr:hypothetical protein [Eubacterium sp.]